MGFSTRGAVTSTYNNPAPRIEEGPRLERDARYPNMVQNGLSGSGKGGNTGGGSNGGNDDPFQRRNRYAMGAENVYGRIGDQPVAVCSSIGTHGWVQSEGTYMTREDGKNVTSVFGKSTGHPDGNIHHHGTHWHGQDGKLHGFDVTGRRPEGNIISKIIK